MSRERRGLGIAVAGIAAAAALLLLAGGNDRGDPDATVTRGTAIGKRRSFRLADGTRVELSVRSTLSYPSRFDADRRAVTLVGEAFFAVAKDTVRPFVVMADSTVVETSGAAFDVRAYPEDSATRVVVDSGAVRVARAPAPAAGSIVSAGERARIGVDGRIRPPETVNPQRYLGWRTGRIEFNDAYLRDALLDLGRWHDVELTIADSVVANRRVTASFASHQTLTEILDGIALQLGARYDRVGRAISFRLER